MHDKNLSLACAVAWAVLVLAPEAGLAQHQPPGAYADLSWRMIGPFRGGRTRAVAGVPVAAQRLLHRRRQRRRVEDRRRGPHLATHLRRPSRPSRSARSRSRRPTPTSSTSAAARGCSVRTCRSATASTAPRTAGRTWAHLGLTGGQQIPELARRPARSQPAVRRGARPPVRRRTRSAASTARATAARTWQRVLYKDDNTGGSAVAIDPAHPDVVYAALWQSRLGPWEDKNEFEGTGGGLFKSTDGGTTWQAPRRRDCRTT